MFKNSINVVLVKKKITYGNNMDLKKLIRFIKKLSNLIVLIINN